MLLKVCCLLVTFGNTRKVDTNAAMNENKNKNQFIMVYNASTFKRKKKDIILRESQVVLYVDQ